MRDVPTFAKALRQPRMKAEVQMLKCAFCGRRVEPTPAWKERDERYYCNSFCAEDAFCAETEQADWPAPARSEPPQLTIERMHEHSSDLPRFFGPRLA